MALSVKNKTTLIGERVTVDGLDAKIIGVCNNGFHIVTENGIKRYHLDYGLYKNQSCITLKSGRGYFLGQRVFQANGFSAEVFSLNSKSRNKITVLFKGEVYEDVNSIDFVNGLLSIDENNNIYKSTIKERLKNIAERKIDLNEADIRSSVRFESLYGKEGVLANSKKSKTMSDLSKEYSKVKSNITIDNKSVEIVTNKIKIGESLRTNTGLLVTPISENNGFVEYVVANKNIKSCRINKSDFNEILNLSIKSPDYTGWIREQVGGLKAKVLYHNEDRVFVQFDCLEVVDASVKDFLEGNIKCSVEYETYLGKIYVQRDNRKIKILAVYEDDLCYGYDETSKNPLPNISLKDVVNGDYIEDGYVGEEFKNKLGMSCKIVRYQDRYNINVEFEDGYIKQNVVYSDLCKGLVVPDYIYNYKGSFAIGLVNKIRGVKFDKTTGYSFKGNCILCDEVVIGTRDDIQKHFCGGSDSNEK